MREVKVTLSDRKYREPWKETSFYCLNCGAKQVWCRDDGGDYCLDDVGNYYQGEHYLCVNCEFNWNLPSEPSKEQSLWYEERVQQIRSALK
jgi:hypothetical protein